MVNSGHFYNYYDRWYLGINFNLGYEIIFSEYFSAIAGVDLYWFNLARWSYEERGLEWSRPELYYFGLNVGIKYRFNFKKK